METTGLLRPPVQTLIIGNGDVSLHLPSAATTSYFAAF